MPSPCASQSVDGDGSNDPEHDHPQAEGERSYQEPPQTDRSERDAAQSAVERELIKGAQAAAALIAKRAQSGDMDAAKLLLERLEATSAHRRISFELRKITSVRDAVDALGDVMQAMANGSITIAEAKTISAQISTLIEAMKGLEFDRRLQVIENYFPELNVGANSLRARVDRVYKFVNEHSFYKTGPMLVFSTPDLAALIFRKETYDIEREEGEGDDAFLSRAKEKAKARCYGQEPSIMTHEQFLIFDKLKEGDE